jgi:hypothetical protein
VPWVRQASWQHLTTEAWVCVQASLCGVCGGQSDTETGFSLSFSFPLSVSFCCGSPYSYITWRMKSRPVGGCSSETQSYAIDMNSNKNRSHMCNQHFHVASHLCDLLIHLLRVQKGTLTTNSLEQSPSLEANSRSASQEIPHLLWNPEVHGCVNKGQPPVPIMNHTNPVHTFQPYFCETSNLCHASHTWSFKQNFI